MYPQYLKDRFKLTDVTLPANALFEQIATKRGFLLRGGDIDVERCAKAILDDFRKGKIGKITFDTPEVLL